MKEKKHLFIPRVLSLAVGLASFMTMTAYAGVSVNGINENMTWKTEKVSESESKWVSRSTNNNTANSTDVITLSGPENIIATTTLGNGAELTIMVPDTTSAPMTMQSIENAEGENGGIVNI